MSEKLPKATHAGELKIGEVVIPCAVLEDGRRVLTQRGLQAAIGMGEGGGVTRMARFVGLLDEHSASKPGISARSGGVVEFRPKRGGRSAFGYDAQIIVDICKAVTRAGRAGSLPAGQYDAIVARCELLMDALAGVAIIALGVLGTTARPRVYFRRSAAILARSSRVPAFATRSPKLGVVPG